jgi:DUF1009 family protein
MTRYGLIAGSGRFPILALEAARKLGHGRGAIRARLVLLPDFMF